VVQKLVLPTLSAVAAQKPAAEKFQAVAVQMLAAVIRANAEPKPAEASADGAGKGVNYGKKCIFRQYL
jgi:hypothetical protein